MADNTAYGAATYGNGTYSPYVLYPAGVTDTDSIGTPGYTPAAAPTGTNDAETVAAPTLTFTGEHSYNLGDYGAGTYTGTPADTLAPHSIGDGEQIEGASSEVVTEPTNIPYGAGIYGTGVYFGTEPAQTNWRYGEGTYGYGDYYGIAVPDTNTPLLPPSLAYTGTPMHLLGIGPWSPTIVWRGAANYGIQQGRRVSRPALSLPPAQSLSFTLRLNEGSEARAEITHNRGDFLLIDEMDTDLWWRRKDPRLTTVEMIGRFNCSSVDVQTSDTGITTSCQFDDYRTVLAERMVLAYKDPVNAESMWDKGTKITDIMAFALPGNTNIDLSAATGSDPADLGPTTQPFTLPPGTTIGDLFDNLLAVSTQPWEWWIEAPGNLNKPPTLRIVQGERGSNKGVVLYDVGGPSPIASWRRVAAADKYANALYYTGGTGGVVDVIQAQIEQYGQRDALDGNSTLGGDINLIQNAAAKKLRELADRRPTYQITLKTGYWRGRSHIDIGDTVAVRIRAGRELIREQFRVSELQVDIDNTGVEQVQLTLGDPLPSANPRSKRNPLIRVLRKLKNYTAPDGAADIPTTT